MQLVSLRKCTNHTSLFSFISLCLPKPQPVHTYGRSIDVIDLADIFTVGKPRKFKRKLKISAQTHEPF
jgi:hypothetical protein